MLTLARDAVTTDLGLRRMLVYVCAWRLGLLALVLAVWAWTPGFFDAVGYAQSFHGAGEAGSLSVRLSTWDAQFYLHLAEGGYSSGASSAFHPLWPALIRAATPLFGGSALLAALMMSHLFFLGACALLYRHVGARHGTRAASASVIALLAYPGAIFFGLVYTESLFLLMSVGLFVALERRHWALVAVLGALLPLTRAVGVLAVLPIAASAHRTRDLWGGVAALAPLLGWAAYFAWMHVSTGDAFAGLEAQTLFRSEASVMKLLDPIGFVAEFFTIGGAVEARAGALDRIVFLGFLAMLVPVWRACSRAELLWVVALGLVSAATVSLMSFTRYAAVLFPIFVVLGIHVARSERSLWASIGLKLALAVQALLLVLHTSNYWVG